MDEQLPQDIEAAVKALEEFRANATPAEQGRIEQARAEAAAEAQRQTAQRQRDEVANKLASKYPALAEAIKNNDPNSQFPALQDAINSLTNVDALVRQREELEERIAGLEANAEAILAGANATLEVRNKRSRPEPTNDTVAAREG